MDIRCLNNACLDENYFEISIRQQSSCIQSGIGSKGIMRLTATITEGSQHRSVCCWISSKEQRSDNVQSSVGQDLGENVIKAEGVDSVFILWCYPYIRTSQGTKNKRNSVSFWRESIGSLRRLWLTRQTVVGNEGIVLKAWCYPSWKTGTRGYSHGNAVGL